MLLFFFIFVLHLAMMTHFDRTMQIEDDDEVGGHGEGSELGG